MLPPALLRGILRVDASDSETTLADNLQMLYAEIRPEGIDAPIVAYAWSLYDRSRTVASYQTLLTYFNRLSSHGDPAGPPGVQRLDGLLPLPALLDAAAYRADLDTHKEDLLRKNTTAVMMEAATILKHGMQVKQRGQTLTVKGPAAAIDRLHEGVVALGSLFRQKVTHSSLAADVDDIWRTYEKAKANPGQQFGVLTGIPSIDKVHGGLQRGELCFVLGFVGHMKSTFCMNWAYKAAVLYGKRVGIVTLETSVEKLRQQIAVLHCQHPQFFDPNVPPITTTGVRMAQLTPPQETIWRAALDDLQHNPQYGGIYYRGADKADITMDDVGAWVRELTRHDELDLLNIDYAGLVAPADARLKGRGTALSEYSNLNQTIREIKLLAGSANDGQGMAIVSPFQANREGLKEAEKNGGRYNLRAMSGANESERSADVIYYCVDERTEALTQRGWVHGHEVTRTDMVASLDRFGGQLVWSPVREVFRAPFDGAMHRLTGAGIDALVTPGHRWALADGSLKTTEDLCATDRLSIMGAAMPDGLGTFSDAYVELVGWTVTEGTYRPGRKWGGSVVIAQKPGPKADRIRAALQQCATFAESTTSRTKRTESQWTEASTGSGCVGFCISGPLALALMADAPRRRLPMPFLLALTQAQRLLLIDTMVDGDGSRPRKGLRQYSQRDAAHMDGFIALCTMAGVRTRTRRERLQSGFGESEMSLATLAVSDLRNVTVVDNLDFHGGRRWAGTGNVNRPTQPYLGMVWCPRTDYGTFVARRNGRVYVTGNTFLDDGLRATSEIAVGNLKTRDVEPIADQFRLYANGATRLIDDVQAAPVV